MKSFSWSCPHCNLPQVVTTDSCSARQFAFDTVKTSRGFLGLLGRMIVCANPDCKEPTITCDIVSARRDIYDRIQVVEPINTHITCKIIPDSYSKQQPDYIPLALRNDYYEACKICDLSPKAAATLARRCLQGMIRDFCNIADQTLFKEIEKLRVAVKTGKAPHGVTPESVEAIDHVRSIGNIGAHMEKDINLIIPVDAGEARLLIDLIEGLFSDWYVARKLRQEKFDLIKVAAEEKKALISQVNAPAQIEPPKEM